MHWSGATCTPWRNLRTILQELISLNLISYFHPQEVHHSLTFPSVTSKVFYTGTFVYGFLLTAGSYSVQLPCQTSKARNQGKFTVVKYLSFRLLLLPLCFLLFTSKLSARTQTKISHYTCPQMPRDHAHWEEHEVKLLLTLAIQEKEKFNWNQFGLTREGWRNIYPHFPQYSRKQINNKFDFLKQKYRAWKDSQVATGLGRNTQTGGIDADPDYWMAQDGSQPIDDDFPHAGVSIVRPATPATVITNSRIYFMLHYLTHV